LTIAGGCLCRAVRFEINAEAPLGARSAPKWACFDPDLPQVEGQPPPLKA
jgi:hypothetical protein